MTNTTNHSVPIALITGGSRGIGKAIAVRMARAGFDIWLNYLNNHKSAQEVQREIEKEGKRCVLLPFDVGDEVAVLSALEPLLDKMVPHTFIHNAGITRDTVLGLMGRVDWDLVVNTNLTSFFILSRLVVQRMMRKRQGRIIAIASVAGETGQAGQVNYSAAKAGLIGACKAMARELAPRNILVNVVSPGFIDTDMTKKLALDQILPMIPLGRAAKPEEVAGIVAFLAGNEAQYITGQVIGVNGGLYI